MEIWIIFYIIIFYLDMGKWQREWFVKRRRKGIVG